MGIVGLKLVIALMVLWRTRYSCDSMTENQPLASFLGITVMISFYSSSYFCESKIIHMFVKKFDFH